MDDVTFVDPTVTVTYQDGTTSTFDLPAGGGLSTVNTEDPVEGDGSTATPVTLTDTAKHSLSQIPALEERTQDLAIEDTYVWADTTDGVISLRSDAPPAPWLQTTIWGATYSYSSQDAGADNTYIVLRIGNSEEVNQFRVEVTKGSNTFYYNGAAFKRIHKSETTHKYYGHPNSNLQSGDELQVQKGTVTGEVTEYRGHVGGASFTAPDGNGNLAATVDTIDELVTAVDDLTTGGGDVTAERTSIYLDAADVAQNTIHSGSFDEAIVAGYTLEFSFSNGGASGTPRAYVQMTSDEFLGLTVQAAAPTTAAQAQGYNIRQIDVTGINTNALDTVYIWRGATDSDFYYDVWRGGNFRLQVFKFVAGGPTGRAGGDGADGTDGTDGMDGADGADGAAGTLDAVDRGRLNSVDGLVAKTADLSIEAVTHSWANVAVLANGGFISHNEIPTTAQAAALTYELTTIGTAADAARPYTLIKIPMANDARDYRISQHLAPDTFYITSWHHIGNSGGFKYYQSHHNLFQGYTINIQYNTVTATQSEFRGGVGESSFTAPDGTGNLADTVDTIDELVAAVDDLSLGGGGGGTDDQTAAEVSVDATGFTGNLATTDDDVQTALDTIDGLSLGGGGGGAVTTSAPVSGDGTPADPVTIANQAIGHTKIGSSVGGVNQTAGRILEADGAGDVRWADKGGGTGTDEYADSLEVDITGQTLTVTVGRTGSLADLEDTATIPDPVSIASLPTQDSALHNNDLLGIWDASDGQVEKVTLGVTRSYMQGIDATGFDGNLATTDDDTQALADKVDDLELLELSDDPPEDVGETADDGDGLAAAKYNHVHALPHDSTLEFDATDGLKVNVQDVIEHLQERIQYHTASSNYSSDAGATVGQAYATSQYRKIITKVEVLLNPLVGADGYLVRLDELNADNSIKAKLFTSNTRSSPFGLGVTPRAFTFHEANGDVGVAIDGSIRLGILISRLGDNSDSAVAAVHGSEVAAGPRKSYDDASVDFDLENDVVYQHIDPGVGQSTHSHGTDIRGNIKIFYTLIIDHGDLLGGAHELTQAQAEDETSTVYGLVSGERLAESVAANETGGGGAITQATEAVLGGVRGATAVQAISSSGTDILGWSVNRMGQSCIRGSSRHDAGGHRQRYDGAQVNNVRRTPRRQRRWWGSGLTTRRQAEVEVETTVPTSATCPVNGCASGSGVRVGGWGRRLD